MDNEIEWRALKAVGAPSGAFIGYNDIAKEGTFVDVDNNPPVYKMVSRRTQQLGRRALCTFFQHWSLE